MCAQDRHHLCNGSYKVDGVKYECECDCHREKGATDDRPDDRPMVRA